MLDYNLEPTHKNLQGLFALRNVVIAAQLVAMLAVVEFFHIGLPLMPMLVVSSVQILANVLTWLRLKKTWPVTDVEFFGQLLLDVTALTVLLYLSGGSTNPFVSLYLLPLTIAAAALPWAYTWAMAGVTLACYSVLLFYFVPIAPQGEEITVLGSFCGIPPEAGHAMDMQGMHGHASDFSLHVLGMWFNFLLSAALIAFFVVRMAASLRERDHLLAATREDVLRNERIVGLGTLAAGAAHELGTPLATMAVVIQELQRDQGSNAELSDNLGLLRNQVDTCKAILTRLVASSGEVRAEGGGAQALDVYLAELLAQWQLLRPQVGVTVQWHGTQPAPMILAEQTLGQAIMNLLNNAADASPQGVEVEGNWDQRELAIEIRDHGPGLTAEAAGKAGKVFFTTKGPEHGLGLGLFLANATIERFGGKVSMFNRPGGGACVRVKLPLERLAMEKAQ
jgi:two-component system, sensor histidine kinase RegB